MIIPKDKNIVKNTFMERFAGKTNRIKKTGMKSILEPIKTDTSSRTNDALEDHKIQNKFKLTPINPEKRAQNNLSTKSNYTPKGMTSQTALPKINKDEPKQFFSSKTLTARTKTSSSKYNFGKYLKLDK